MNPTDELMAKLAPYLAGLPSNAARLAFLQAKEAQIEAAYQRFIETEGDSHPNRNAADFVCSIAALQIEQAKYRQVAA